jgi:hypothetical protein
MEPDFSTVAAKTYNGFAVSRQDEVRLVVASPRHLMAIPGPASGARGGGWGGVAALLVLAALFGGGIGYGAGFMKPKAIGDLAALGRDAAAQFMNGGAPQAAPASDVASGALPFDEPQISPQTTAPRDPYTAEASPRERRAREAPGRPHLSRAHVRHAVHAKPKRQLVDAAQGRPRTDCAPGPHASARDDCGNEDIPLERRLDMAFGKAAASGAGAPDDLTPPY